MAKKEKKKTLINKLDKLTSLKVRSHGQCERCGNTRYELLQPSHIYSRTVKILRWDLENLHCLCAGCHFWAHQHPADFTDWIRLKWPGRIESLREKMKKPTTLTVQYYQKILAELESENQ